MTFGDLLRRVLRRKPGQHVRDAAITFLDRRRGQPGANLGRRESDSQPPEDPGSTDR